MPLEFLEIYFYFVIVIIKGLRAMVGTMYVSEQLGILTCVFILYRKASII